jgi:amidase
MVEAIASRDVNEPAARTFPSVVPDYLAALSGIDLSGMRIGVWRDYSGAGKNTEIEDLFEQSIAALRAAGAEVVDPVALADREGMGSAEGQVLRYEFKNDIREYLESHGSPNGMSSLADLIAFNEANAEQAMPYFKQERFVSSEEKGPLSDQEYLDALEKSRTLARTAIDGALEEYQLDALISPTNGPAGLTSLENGDDWSESVGSSSLPAVSGYPSVTVPMGFVNKLPIGLSVFGAAYTEATLLRIAYGFEQSTQARQSPKFLPTLSEE